MELMYEALFMRTSMIGTTHRDVRCRNRRRGRTERLCLLGLWAMVMFAITGCKVDQQKEVAVYRDVLNAQHERAPAPFDPNQPLPLDLALELANWHNEQLAIKGETYLQALIDKERVVADFVPKIIYAPVFTWQEKLPSSDSLVKQFVPRRTVDQPLSAEIDLDAPASAMHLKQAESEARRQQSLLLHLKSSLLLDVAKVYYQVLMLEAQKKVLAYSVSVQADQVTLMQNKHRAGAARPLDIAQAKAQRARTNVLLTRTRNDITAGRAQLALLIGVPAVRGTLSDTLQVPARLPNNEQLIDIAERHRQDLQAAKFQVEASVHFLHEAWSRYFPSVSLNFTYFLSRQSFPSQIHWINTLEFNLPIFSAGLIHEDVRTAWSRLRQAKLYQSYLVRQVNQEFTVAVHNFAEAAGEIADLQVEVTSAHDALQRSMHARNAGLAIYLDQLQARDQLQTTELQLTSARLQQKIVYLKLMQVLGRFDEASLQQGFTLTAAREPAAADPVKSAEYSKAGVHP